MTRTTLTIAATHPACEGHFPGSPVLPAVLLLDEALWAWERSTGTPPGSWEVSAAKFLAPVRPGQTLDLTHEREAGGGVRFTFAAGSLTVASGVLRAAAGTPEGR